MLARFVPAPLLRVFARPYIAGASIEEALETAAWRQEKSGARATLDLLGEEASESLQVIRTLATYEELVDLVGTDERFAGGAQRPSLSLKPSALTTGERAEILHRLVALGERARSRKVALTLDMEDHRWTEDTLSWALECFRRGMDVGTVLQTRLHRTEGDLERIPPGMRVRLVIGIYREEARIALTAKAAMKERMLVYASRLLERGAFVEFATHDETLLRRFLSEVAPGAPHRCEIQMLLGVPREHFCRRLAAGDFGVVLPHRLYVPFALSWDDATAYLRRRMEESPSLIWLVLRNLLRPRHR